MNKFDVLLVGVGGQGIILASDILSNLGLELGLDVKKSEVHGMSQRGGSVESHVRIGAEVLSPLIPRGQADFVLSMEEVEPLRYLDVASPDATILVSNQRVVPTSVTGGGEVYPGTDAIRGELERHFRRVLMLDVGGIMRKLDNFRTANIILLGALSAFMPFPVETWRKVLAASLPQKILAINEKAFDEGRAVGLALGAK